MMKRGAWYEALTLLEQLLAIDDEEPDFHAARAWCLFNANPDTDADPSEMLLSVNAALKKHPDHDKALFYKGLILKRSGDLSRAMGAFYQAYQANRTNIDAKRELRLLKQLGVRAKLT
jgi:tetratricopeptide (TPR) repeat protein